MALSLLLHVDFLAAHADGVGLGVDRYGECVRPFFWLRLKVTELAELILRGFHSEWGVDSEGIIL